MILTTDRKGALRKLIINLVNGRHCDCTHGTGSKCVCSYIVEYCWRNSISINGICYSRLSYEVACCGNGPGHRVCPTRYRWWAVDSSIWEKNRKIKNILNCSRTRMFLIFIFLRNAFPFSAMADCATADYEISGMSSKFDLDKHLSSFLELL